MLNKTKLIKIRRPDDFHVHFRDGEILKTVVPYSSYAFGRVMVMPNLSPPITTINQAKSYKQRIIAAVPKKHNFVPLITCYLTDNSDKNIIQKGFEEKIFFACKFYPINSTTNSKYGVSDIKKIYPIISRMEKIGMPLLIHGEVIRDEIDIFDQEAYFIDRIMDPMRKEFPNLKMVLEHISSKEAVQYILQSNQNTAATITPQHLMFNRNDLLHQKIKPHLYCLPILKRKIHQDALRKAIKTNCKKFFLGTDSAPHIQITKESSCGCAGIFNSPTALSAYATIFDEINAMENFESFCSLNGARFYGLPINSTFIELKRKKNIVTNKIFSKKGRLIQFLENKNINWKIKIL